MGFVRRAEAQAHPAESRSGEDTESKLRSRPRGRRGELHAALCTRVAWTSSNGLSGGVRFAQKVQLEHIRKANSSVEESSKQLQGLSPDQQQRGEVDPNAARLDDAQWSKNGNPTAGRGDTQNGAAGQTLADATHPQDRWRPSEVHLHRADWSLARLPTCPTCCLQQS